MSSLYLSFTVVFPLFIMISLGYFLRRIKLFNDDFLRQLNNLCFKVFLPLILFINVYNSDFYEVFSARLVLFALIGVICCFAVLMIAVPLIEKDNARRGVMIQGMFRSNFILFGIPVASAIFGAEGAAVASILIAFVIPLFNVLAVVALSFFGDKKDYKKIFKSIVTNPLIIASAIAFIFALSGLKMPKLLETTISDIAKVATPLSIIILGGSFAFAEVKKNAKPLSLVITAKLVVIPLIFMTIAILLGFRGMELVGLFALFASPTAVSSFTMAQSMGADHELAGQVVVGTSIFSILTIFIGVLVLSNFGFI